MNIRIAAKIYMTPTNRDHHQTQQQSTTSNIGACATRSKADPLPKSYHISIAATMSLVVYKVVDNSHGFAWSEESLIIHVHRLEDCLHLHVLRYGFVHQISALWGMLTFRRHCVNSSH
jgi:hypothetical protein